MFYLTLYPLRYYTSISGLSVSPDYITNSSDQTIAIRYCARYRLRDCMEDAL